MGTRVQTFFPKLLLLDEAKACHLRDTFIGLSEEQHFLIQSVYVETLVLLNGKTF